jgi:signal transduction histidine kinase
MFRRLRGSQLGFDLVLAVVFLAFSWIVVLRSEDLTDLVVAVVLSGALAIRRLSPSLSLAVAWLGAILQMALMASTPTFSDLAILAVLYATAVYGSARVRWVGLGSAAFGSLVATAYLLLVTIGGGDLASSELANPGIAVRDVIGFLIASLAVLGLSWTVGLLVFTYRRARESRTAQRAAEQDVVVEQERNRIARDMHDVVAHSLAVVIAQADGARYARTNDPEAVDSALIAISSTAREALGDVRVLLAQLRHSQGDAPQPVLADLDRLVVQLTDSGLDVRRTDRGTPAALPSGQQLALFRIVQEALTNALRHGDLGEPVELVFDWGDPVRLAVSSARREETMNPDGHGLAGMRERAVLAGGSLTAGADGTRWVVTASLPAPVAA